MASSASTIAEETPPLIELSQLKLSKTAPKYSLPRKPRQCHAEASLRSSFCCSARFLADANVDRTPRPRARPDVDPGPSRTAIPGGQVHPFVIPEPAEAEMASVLEEVTAGYAVTKVT